MAKDTFYFSHDYNPLSDLKMEAMIAKYGAVGYGIYWRIVELLHCDEKHMLQHKPYVCQAIAKQIGTDANIVTEFIKDCIEDYGLFLIKDDMFYSARVMRNIEKRQAISETRKAAGSKGGTAKHSNTVANAKQNVANKGKKGKERKVFIPPRAVEVQDFFADEGYSRQLGLKAFEYYDKAEWKDSKGKQVLNWKQKMRGNWFRPENLFTPPQQRKVVI